MAKTSKEMADALAAMMNGQPEGEPAAEHDDAQVAMPAQPAISRALPAPTMRPKAAQPSPAAAPVVAAPSATQRPAVRRPAPVPNPVAVPPIAPAAVPEQATTVPKRPSRPSAPQPVAAAPAPQPVAKPTAAKPARKDAPARPAPVDYAKPKAAKPARLPFYATLDFRQTVIPPLLVAGGGLIVLAILFFIQPDDAALRQLSATIPIVLGLVGLVLLAMAALNMSQVSKQLASRAADVQRDAKRVR